VFEADLPKLKLGQKAKIRVVGLNDNEPITGVVNFISPSVNPMTHAITLRVDLPNGSGLLKTEMFAKAEISVSERTLPVLPRSSVVQDGAESFVMVRAASGLFERRSVVITSANDPSLFAVTKGLIDGDLVVVDGGVLIDRSIGTAKIAKEAKATAMKEKDEDNENDKASSK
jgi:Cu(I)/Ag(I) efflux system membrane fusion protein